jgi:NitT/TauT family transport system substrate-binding protein
MRTFALATLIAVLAAGTACSSRPVGELRMPRGAGGIGFLPLLVVEKQGLIEKHARAAGLDSLTVRWSDIGGPSAMNDALLSGAVDYIAAGPPSFLTLWDRTRGSIDVSGVAAITSLPMYLNTRAEHLHTVDDLRDGDKIAVTAIKVSIPALVMQMYAARKYGASDATRFDRHTVSMTHPDGVVALLSGGGIAAHFTSPPFHQRERRDPRVRTIMTSDEVMGGPTTFTMLSTTRKFREEKPQVYAAVLEALKEANRLIVADPRTAASLLMASAPDSGFTLDETVAMLQDPAVRFTTTPQNVEKYAAFMHDTGSITTRPAGWKDLFFPDIHGVPGS